MSILTRAAAAVAAGTVVAGVAAGLVAAPRPAQGVAHAALAASPSAALLAEANRELAAMRSTHYQHHTDVDESDGSYDYDCSGLVDHALRRAAPAALAALPVTTSSRPLAADIERHIAAATTGTGPWRAVATVGELAPGDLVAWLATEDSTNDDTGHVMIVAATPRPNPGRPGEWLVRVIDSTVSPHADDSRHKPTTGLGTGVIGLVTDQAGRPTAFYWRGGLSPHAKPTEIALGRLA